MGSIGTISSSIEVEASSRYLGLASGAHKSATLWRELCSGVNGESRIAPKEYQMAFHWRIAIK